MSIVTQTKMLSIFLGHWRCELTCYQCTSGGLPNAHHDNGAFHGNQSECCRKSEGLKESLKANRRAPWMRLGVRVQVEGDRRERNQMMVMHWNPSSRQYLPSIRTSLYLDSLSGILLGLRLGQFEALGRRCFHALCFFLALCRAY